MNWGNKLLIVFIAFGTLIGYMVYRCIGSSVDLVSADYYKQELAYQEIIDGKKNASALSSEATITQQENSLLICLPAEMKGQPITGTIWLYCVSSSAKDKKIKMQTDTSACQKIPLPASGTYTAKLRWQQAGHEYFHEQQLILR